MAYRVAAYGNLDDRLGSRYGTPRKLIAMEHAMLLLHLALLTLTLTGITR